MEAKHTQPGRGFRLWWVFTSTVGFGVSYVLALVATVRAVSDESKLFVWVVEAMGFDVFLHVVATVCGAVGGAVGGLLAGAMQLVRLRQQVSRSRWWVLTSTVGFAAIFALLFLATELLLEDDVSVVVLAVALVAIGGVGGALTGVVKCLISRRQVSRCTGWVLASSVGWLIGLISPWAAMAAIVTNLPQRSGARVAGLAAEDLICLVAGPTGTVIGGAMSGAITGAALLRLLRHPVSETSSIG